jgi:hypothetical protein
MTKLKAIVVEDNTDDVYLLLHELKTGGFDVTHRHIETAGELESALAQGGWDIVLCDYSLPTFSAPEALQLVKQSGLDLPFIVVSGTIGEEVAVEAMRAGATDYVLKGKLTRLCPAVRRALEEWEKRKQLEKTETALGESRARIKRLTENLPDIVYRFMIRAESTDTAETEPIYDLEYVSAAAETITGFAPAEMQGGPERWLPFVHPADVESIVARFERQEFELPVVARIKTKSGSYAWLEFRSAAVRNQHGAVTAIEGVARDITEQRKLEKRLRMAQRMEAIGQLAGGLAHDLNNLLTVIDGCATLVARDKAIDADGKELLSEIITASRRAGLLTNQLLAFGRRQIRKVEVVSLNEVVESMASMLERLIGEDVDLETMLATELDPVAVDVGQIQQILMNLAANARDAMPRGGKLTLETAAVAFDEQYAADHPVVDAGRYVMLAMSDNGVGMDEETRSHVFEPFFTTKAKGKGTGLGLATVYGIVKQSGGYIWVYSEPKRGATFKIYLPAVTDKVVTPMREKEVTPEMKGSETIMVVEDEPGVVRVAVEVLEKAGYRVLQAEGGNQAIALFDRHGAVDLLLTDVVMPEMSGKQLVEQLTPRSGDMKVLYMSGYTDNAVVHHGVLDLDTNFLQKPFTPRMLLAKVREVLDT